MPHGHHQPNPTSTQPQLPQPNLNLPVLCHSSLNFRYQRPSFVFCTSSARRKRRRSCQWSWDNSIPREDALRRQGLGFFWPARPQWLSPSYFWRRMCKGILLPAAGAASKPAKHHPAPATVGISGHIWTLDIATPTAIDKLWDTEVSFVCQPIEKY